MIRWRIVLSVSILCFNVLTNHHISKARDIIEVEYEEYAIYSTLIEKQFLKYKTKLLVIKGQTLEGSAKAEDKVFHLKERLQTLTQDTLEDFDQKNRESADLKDMFSVSIRRILVSSKEVEQFFSRDGGGWEAFYKKYPNSRGLISFSRVGFNQTKDRALVYVNHSCGGRCGTGKYYALLKERGKWSIGSEFLLLAS